MMLSKFSFFRAGQGSFYGGRIYDRDNNSKYSIIYDCGTSNFIKGNSASLNSEINWFKEHENYRFPIENNTIDLLFISHLDYDHVSGLKRILNEFDVKKIVIPYIEKEIRKYFLSSFSDDEIDTEDLSEENYINFLENPINFFRENSQNNNSEIYFIKTNENNNDNNNGNEIELAGNEIELEGNRLEKNTITELANTDENIYLYDNNIRFLIRNKWEFTTFFKEVNLIKINELDSCIKDNLRINDNEELSFESIKSIIIENRAEVRKCYIKMLGDINSYGLILIHGPINFSRISVDLEPDCFNKNFNVNNPYFKINEFHYGNEVFNMFFTLLLGDVSINQQLINGFNQNFIERLTKTLVVQIPHHGSSKNWDLTQFKNLKIGKEYYFPPLCHNFISVCSFGYGNRYGHPSHEVINDLKPSLFLNSQFSRLNINYQISF